MIPLERVALVLLAAGLSRRFGPQDKLAAPLEGLPLGLHVASRLGALPFAAKIAVTRRGGIDLAPAGFVPVVNVDPAAGQAGSIGLGVSHARRARPQAILIVLADMPFVTVAHVRKLIARCGSAYPVVGSTDGHSPSPPALFDASMFDALEALRGDTGARGLLRTAALVHAPAFELADVDRPGDLDTLPLPGEG